MAFIDRGQTARADTPPPLGRRRELFAAILLVTTAAALALRDAVPPDAFAPAVATLLFVLAAMTAGIAFVCRSVGARAAWFDVASMLTFVGVTISIQIDPDQMVRLVATSERHD